MIDKRIEFHKKENARLFKLINDPKLKTNTDTIIKTINEHEAIIRELKLIKKLTIPDVVPSSPSKDEIRKEADKYEEKASCGTWNGTYVNEDFIAGAEYVLDFISN